MGSFVQRIQSVAQELGLKEYQASNALKLMFDDACTVPFVARYRKEMTGSLDEVVLRQLRDRYQYLMELDDMREKYLKVVKERAETDSQLKAELPKLTEKFNACTTKQALEDLYLPYKPKRRTRAQVAREKGLNELLNRILAECASITDLNEVAKPFVSTDPQSLAADKIVSSPEDALQGALDILAEMISENADYRSLVRQMSFSSGYLVSVKNQRQLKAGDQHSSTSDGEAEKTMPIPSHGKRSVDHYDNYYQYREAINKAQSHRIMAIRRGEAEGALKVMIEVAEDAIIDELKRAFFRTLSPNALVKSWLEIVIKDAYKRLISPSIETEMRLELKKRAETDAIRVFSKNLNNLLMLPPLPRNVVLGVDPGLRTGSKLAVVSDTGKLLDHATIHPNYKSETSEATVAAALKILQFIKTHQVNYIAIGNGTGCKEIDGFIRTLLTKYELKEVRRVVVNEAGASVYSADEIAREEFPDLDATIRSAVSIARRLQDPLAELVKIDPRSIGVGQYQHDVNVNQLSTSLKDVVESCVNQVGVNLNTASYKLLSYVSGIGPSLAKNIVKRREASGPYKSRKELTEVTGFGVKAFEQAAGFLRVPEASNPLDNSAVHPERYPLVQQIMADLGMTVADVLQNQKTIDQIPWERYVTETVGMPTLRDIREELIKPGRDPREEGSRLHFSDDVSEITDLKPGMKLKGSVTNVTNFGAFVDIGVHQDGLVHISELSDQFVTDASAVVSVGDVLDVTVLEVDVGRKRISLSCRSQKQEGSRTAGSQGSVRPAHTQKNSQIQGTNSNHQQSKQQVQHHNTPMNVHSKNRDGHKASGKTNHNQGQSASYSVDDLLAKFGKGK